MTYGVNYPDLLRDTASYVDRIIEGGRPDQLPVQLPTKFELTINLKSSQGTRAQRSSIATRGRR